MIQQYKGVRATNIPHLLMTGTNWDDQPRLYVHG